MSTTNVLLASHFRARQDDPSEQDQHQHQHPEDDDDEEPDLSARLDAARALLGVGPSSALNRAAMTAGLAPAAAVSELAQEERNSVIYQRRPRSNSAGLDALAFLATKEHASMDTTNSSASASASLVTIPTNHRPLVASAISSSCSSAASSDDDDSAAMPPPPPRRRRRSMSNPEGMDRYTPRGGRSARLHFVLPASILEEELAEANAAMMAKAQQNSIQNQTITSSRKRACPDATGYLNHDDDDDKDDEHGDDDAEHLSQDELLRRARSRLLEDLSEGCINGEKGVLSLPHSLAKYKEVYSKNGRIGIYTPAERAAIISRFHDKRSRRVWNKKIRYNCRKNLADRRMRVKGRFVKRSTEQMAKLQAGAAAAAMTVPQPVISLDLSQPSTLGTSAEDVDDDDDGKGIPPDVDDPDAGFCPTDDQPFRRLRRHTIT